MIATILWLGWIAAFLIIEGIAIYRQRWPDTLSWHVWRWFSVRDHLPAWRLRRALLLAFLAWLVVHFLGGGVIV